MAQMRLSRRRHCLPGSESLQFRVILRLEKLYDLLVACRKVIELLLYVKMVAVGERRGHVHDRLEVAHLLGESEDLPGAQDVDGGSGAQRLVEPYSCCTVEHNRHVVH